MVMKDKIYKFNKKNSNHAYKFFYVIVNILMVAISIIIPTYLLK